MLLERNNPNNGLTIELTTLGLTIELTKFVQSSIEIIKQPTFRFWIKCQNTQSMKAAIATGMMTKNYNPKNLAHR